MVMKEDQDFPYWHISRVAPCVIMTFCCLLGIPGNLAVLLTVKRTLQSNNFTLRLILNLAVCDLMALLCMPLAIYNLWRDWALGAVVCKLLFFLLHSSLNASVLTITLLSLHRYVQVLYPQRWSQLGRSGEEALLLSLWGLAGVIACPAIATRGVKPSGSQRTCSCQYKDRGQKAADLVLQTLLGFVVPCCLLVASYFCLQKRLSKPALFRQRRLTKMVTWIVASFFSFWTPMHTFNVVAMVNLGLNSPSVERVCGDAWHFLNALGTVNSCLNPFFYAFASAKMHRTPQPHLINI